MSKENVIFLSYITMLFVFGIWTMQKWFNISMGFEWVVGAIVVHSMVRVAANKFLK